MKEILSEVIDGSFRLLETVSPRMDEVDLVIAFILFWSFTLFILGCGTYSLVKWIIGRLFDR